MCQHLIYERNRDLREDSRLLVTEFGCDGQHHAVRQTELFLDRRGQVFRANFLGICSQGKCDGSCQGKETLGMFEYVPARESPCPASVPTEVELPRNQSTKIDPCFCWG